MSSVFLERSQGRSGQLTCACDPLGPEADQALDEPASAVQIGVLALCSGFTLISQALVLTIVPIGGAVLASGGPASILPFALLMIGATLATVPAAWLTGVDQRWGFALGSTLGIAGACIAAWGMVAGIFGAFALGAFWLGLAQGFGNFYRHGAASLRGNDGRAVALVIGAGSLAALVVPSALSLARDVAGPLATAAALLMAATAHLCASALAFALPRAQGFAAHEQRNPSVQRLVLATGAGAAAWGGMALMMGLGPSLMTDCGIGVAETSGIVAWHVLAMYAPALPAGFLITRARAPLACGLGLVAIAAGLTTALHASTPSGFLIAMLLSGAGWSTATIAATTLIHAEGAPSRAVLAGHDLLLLVGALAGASASLLFH